MQIIGNARIHIIGRKTQNRTRFKIGLKIASIRKNPLHRLEPCIPPKNLIGNSPLKKTASVRTLFVAFNINGSFFSMVVTGITRSTPFIFAMLFNTASWRIISSSKMFVSPGLVPVFNIWPAGRCWA